MKTILVLIDFSKRSEHAAEFALAVAAKIHSEVVFYNSFYIPDIIQAAPASFPYHLEDFSLIEQNNLEKLEDFSEQLIKKMENTQNEFPRPVIRCMNEPGSLRENILKIAAEKKAWMIIMGDKSKDSLLNHFIFGSDTYGVIDSTTCPVILVPEQSDLKPIKKIAFATDLLKSDKEALHFLVQLAYYLNAEIEVIHIYPPKTEPRAREKGLEEFKKLRQEVNYFKINFHAAQSEEISKTLAGFSQNEGIGLLATVHKGQPFFNRMLKNSVTKEMISYHRVPLLVFPEKLYPAGSNGQQTEEE